VHGPPGSGKTQVVFDMAQTLAVNGQTVIYVVAEGLQGYRGRKRAWQKFHKLGSGNLFIWNQAVHLFDSGSVQSFLQVIKPKRPTLIVFDTLSRCSLGADENSQKDYLCSRLTI
jgi:predicted ATP-dependent serine protease